MNKSDKKELNTQAMNLIRSQRTMVLSTCSSCTPWTAPVYYVFVTPGFYFFSNPQSSHIRQTAENNQVAAAIFTDSDRWEQIQGLQMTGRICTVKKKIEQLKIIGRYLIKFPFARPFLASDRNHVIPDKIRLYVFEADKLYYMNNQFGFGHKELIPI